MDKGYTKQFKEQAMTLVLEQGYTASAASRELGMPTHTLCVWLRKVGWKALWPEPTPLSDDPAVLKVRGRELAIDRIVHRAILDGLDEPLDDGKRRAQLVRNRSPQALAPVPRIGRPG